MTKPETLIITQPDDWHLHLRDWPIMWTVLPYTVRWARRAIVMPNGPMIRTTAEAEDYRRQICKAAGDRRLARDFEPLMTLYLTPETDPHDLVEGWKRGVITAVKRYPRGATTGSEGGVDDIESTAHVLEAMQEHGIPLLCHPELVYRNGDLVDDYDREEAFMDEIGEPLIHDFPALPIVMEHISKRAGVQFMETYGSTTRERRLGATVTSQHLFWDRRDRYSWGGNAPDLTCRPFIGRKEDKEALGKLVSKRPDYLFLGTDSAPHLESKKASAHTCPCGCFNAPNAIGMYAHVFEELGVLDYLEDFAARNGPRFYELPINNERITLVRESWSPNSLVSIGSGEYIRIAGYRSSEECTGGGGNLTVNWRLAA